MTEENKTVEVVQPEISETQKKAQVDYLSALGIRLDGRRS